MYPGFGILTNCSQSNHMHYLVLIHHMSLWPIYNIVILTATLLPTRTNPWPLLMSLDNPWKAVPSWSARVDSHNFCKFQIKLHVHSDAPSNSCDTFRLCCCQNKKAISLYFAPAICSSISCICILIVYEHNSIKNS